MKRSKNESRCFGGFAEKHELFVSGINTLVRLPNVKICSDESQMRLLAMRRAREKISDRWNNVWAEAPENVMFSRDDCSSTVPFGDGRAAKNEIKRSKIECQCLERNVGKRREFGCGIKTRVRLPRRVFCAPLGGGSHAKALRRKGDHDDVRSAHHGG